jgi:hypothetical protein
LSLTVAGVDSNLTELKLTNTIMTGAEKTLKWLKAYVEMNKTYPLITEIEAQLEMAIDEEQVKLLATPAVSKCEGNSARELLLDFVEYMDKLFYAHCLISESDIDDFLSQQ